MPGLDGAPLCLQKFSICLTLDDYVLIKVTRQSDGVVDGIDLSHFEPGRIYDVASSLATYLITIGAAVVITHEETDPASLAPSSAMWRRPSPK